MRLLLDEFELLKDEPFDVKVELLKVEAIELAKSRFYSGDFSNPYCLKEQILHETNPIRKGQAMLYEEEITKLLKERICPCCGQYTLRDFDW